MSPWLSPISAWFKAMSLWFSAIIVWLSLFSILAFSLFSSSAFNPNIATGRVETGISDGNAMFELAMGIIGLGIDSLRITFVGDTKEFITEFGTGLNVSISDT